MVAEAGYRVATGSGDRKFIIGSVIAGALPIVVAPVLTRVFSAEALASYSAYATLLLVVGSMGTARIETLIPGAGRREEARDLAQLAVVGGVTAAALSALILRFIPAGLQAGSYDITLLRAALPVGVVLFTLDAVFGGLLLRHGETGSLARARIGQNAVRPLVQIGGAAVLLPSSGLLAAGSIAGQCAALMQLWFGSRVRRTGITRGWTTSALLMMGRRHSSFVGVAAPSAVVNALAVNVQLLALAAVLPREAYGHMAVTAGLAGVPVTLLVPALRQLVMRDLGFSMRSGGGTAAAISAALRRAVPVAFLVAVGGVVVGPLALPFLLGQDWSDTARYIIPLSLSASVQLIVAPMGSIFPMLHRMGIQLRLDLIRVGAVVAWIVAANAAGADPLMMVWGSAMLVAGSYVWAYLLVHRLARNHDRLT